MPQINSLDGQIIACKYKVDVVDRARPGEMSPRWCFTSLVCIVCIMCIDLTWSAEMRKTAAMYGNLCRPAHRTRSKLSGNQAGSIVDVSPDVNQPMSISKANFVNGRVPSTTGICVDVGASLGGATVSVGRRPDRRITLDCTLGGLRRSKCHKRRTSG